jgi:hypothetical protein
MTNIDHEARRKMLLRTIAHWQTEKDNALAQIESGKYPEYDDNCRAYIKECTGYIKHFARLAGVN